MILYIWETNRRLQQFYNKSNLITQFLLHVQDKCELEEVSIFIGKMKRLQYEGLVSLLHRLSLVDRFDKSVIQITKPTQIN